MIRLDTLLDRARNGENDAWEALLGRVRPIIWALCRPLRLTVHGQQTGGPFVPLATTQPSRNRTRRPNLVEVELTEPAGRERLFALWTRQPLALRSEELRQIGERGELPLSDGYRATRDMKRVQESIHELAPDDWRVAVLELDHQAARGVAIEPGPGRLS